MKNKLSTLIAVAAVGLSMTSFAASAKDHHNSPIGYGPQGFAPSTIAELRQSAYDEQIVVLKGRLTNYLGHDHYVFTDATGNIEVELDDDYDWSFISKDQLILLTAEVDRDFMSLSLEAIRAIPVERTLPPPAPMPRVKPLIPPPSAQATPAQAPVASDAPATLEEKPLPAEANKPATLEEKPLPEEGAKDATLEVQAAVTQTSQA